MRRVVSMVFAAVLAIAPSLAAPATKYFVHVRVPSLEVARQLALAGFDVAGVNKKEQTVGIVATAEELDRLQAMGYAYTIERANDALSIAALQDYTDPNEMSAFVDQVIAAHPNLVKRYPISGPLFEGGVVYAVEITADVNAPNDRPVFLLDSQHHAREVMTLEIAKDMIDYLTSRYATDAQVQRWVDNVRIVVVPSVNPEGAQYVFTNDNMWRKNRHPACPVDNNRNYTFAWGSCNGSSASCTEQTTRGLSPASEPETQAMIQLAADLKPFYALSYHTYGEYIMYSYGCNDPDEMTAMHEVALSLNGILLDDAGLTNSYTVGPIWSAIYLVDGGSVDTLYAQHGIYAYTIEASSSSFQPDYATWRNITVQRHRTAWQFFLNRTLDGPQIRGKITNAVTGQPVQATVAMQEVTFTHGEAPRRSAPNGNYYWLARAGQTYHMTYSNPGYCTVSAEVSVGTGPATVDVALVPPTPPTGVTAQGNGDNRIDVTWSPAIGAVSYRVLRSLSAGGPYTEIATVPAPQTSYSDLTVSGNAVYHYVVRAMQPCDSGSSASASASTTGVCFAGPAFSGVGSATNAEGTTCGIDLTWPSATGWCGGPVTYRVHRATSPGFVPGPSNLIASGLTGNAFTDSDALINGSAYSYVVRAFDAASGADDGNTVVLSAAPTGPVTTGTWVDDGGDGTPAALTLSGSWSVLPTGGKAEPKVYATGTYANSACLALTTPVMSIQTGSALSFASKYSIEKDWDAGIVEVSEGPAFSSWTKLTTVNYPDGLLNTGNACGFPTSFSGTVFSRNVAAPTYPTSSYTGSLAAFAGKDIKLRWRLGSDSTGTFAGWWIDDVSVTNATFRQVCATGTSAHPSEAGPMTASRAAAGTAVDLLYTPACGALDGAVYWGTGPITGAPAWTGAACGLGMSGAASFDPGDPAPGELIYFVLVGQNDTEEGSYGLGFDGERPEAVGVGTCERPQVLGGACP